MMPDTVGTELDRLRAEYRSLEGRLGRERTVSTPDGRARALLRAEARAVLGAIVILERASADQAPFH